jgi:hypothetical protein
MTVTLRSDRSMPSIAVRIGLVRFTINAIPAMALLARGQAGKNDDPTATMWEFP